MPYRKHRSDHTITGHMAAGTSHGLRYLTAADGDLISDGVPLLYDAAGNVVSTATITGDSSIFVTHDSGSKTAGNVPKYDSNGNLTDSGSTPGGGGGSSWTLAGEWHHSVSGDTASPVDFTSLGSYGDLLLIARLVSTSVSGTRVFYASVDGGSTYYTSSGDYVDVNSSGVESNVVAWNGHATATTAARTIIGYVPRAGVNGGPKPMIHGGNNTTSRWFVASTNDVDAVRFANLGGGNLTGGDVWVYVR